MTHMQEIELFENKKNSVTIAEACDIVSCQLAVRVGDNGYTGTLTNGVGVLELGSVPDGLGSVTYHLNDSTGSVIAYGVAVLLQVEGGECPAIPSINEKIAEHNADEDAHAGVERKLAQLKTSLEVFPAEIPDTQDLSSLTLLFNMLLNAVRGAVSIVLFVLLCGTLYAEPVRFGNIKSYMMIETNGVTAAQAANIASNTFQQSSDTLADVAARGGFAGTETISPAAVTFEGGNTSLDLLGLSVVNPTSRILYFNMYQGFLLQFILGENDNPTWQINGSTLDYSADGDMSARWSFSRPAGTYTVAATSDLDAYTPLTTFNTHTNKAVVSDQVRYMWYGTQTNYDLIVSKNTNTLYLIKE